jgi:hypothetical protein
MKFVDLSRVSSIVIVLAGVSSAQAVVVDFESLSGIPQGTNAITYASPVDTQGYTFVTPAQFNTDAEFASWTDLADANTTFSNYTGSVALFSNPGSPITLTKTGGDSFDLLSLDVANVYRQGGGQPVENVLITGNLAGGGTVTKSFLIPNDNALHNVTFTGFTGLSSVVLSSPLTDLQITYFQIDNVSVQETQAVPEPSTMAAIGLGALAVFRRRR